MLLAVVILLFQFIDKKEHSVGDIDIADAAVEIEGEEVYIGHKRFDTFLYSSCDNVVGDAAEWLEAAYFVHYAFYQRENFD